MSADVICVKLNRLNGIFISCSWLWDVHIFTAEWHGVHFISPTRGIVTCNIWVYISFSSVRWWMHYLHCISLQDGDLVTIKCAFFHLHGFLFAVKAGPCVTFFLCCRGYFCGDKTPVCGTEVLFKIQNTLFLLLFCSCSIGTAWVSLLCCHDFIQLWVVHIGFQCCFFLWNKLITNYFLGVEFVSTVLYST